MKNKRNTYMLWSIVFFALVSLFQNCAPMQFTSQEIGQLDLPSNSQAEVTTPALYCYFNGQRINDGDSVSAYKIPNVPYNETCDLEQRKCEAGILAGTYQYSSCAQDESKTEILTVQQTTTYNPFKLLIVVDDSYTMSQSQAQLSANLDSLLNPLKGMNVDVKVVTTSDVVPVSGTISYLNAANEVAMSKPISSAALSESDLFGRNHSLDLFDTIPYQIYPKLKVELNYGETKGTTLSFLAKDSAASVTQKINSLKGLITKAGVAGSDSERAFCPILRHVLGAESADKNSFLQKGDRVAFLVLSDEDDQSSVSNCLQDETIEYSEIKRDLKSAEYRQYAIEDTKIYFLAQWSGYHYTINPAVYRDGLLVSAEQKVVSSSLSTGQLYVSSCAAALSEAQRSLSGSKDSLTITSCSQEESKGYKATSEQGYLAYIAGGGKKYYSNVISATYSAPYRSSLQKEAKLADLNPKASAQEFDIFLLNKVKNVFGENYFFSFIIAKTGTTKANGQSYGTRYEGLEKQEASKIKTSSIKSSSYALALGQISDYISNQIIEKYSLNLPEGAKIVEVKINNLVLDPSKYVYTNGLLEIKVSMKSQDKVEVRYIEKR